MRALLVRVVAFLSVVGAVPAAAQDITTLDMARDGASRAEVEILLKSGRYTTMTDALAASGLQAELDTTRATAVFAPTDAAWENLPSGTVDFLLRPENSTALRRVVGCHIVTDPVLPSAIQSIEETRSGSYDFRSVGGCNYSASWAGNGVSIEDDRGVVVTVLSGNDRVSGISEVQVPVGYQFDGEIRVARLFAGPTQYPPRSFSAYGIVAFPARSSSSSEMNRHRMLCEAYVNGIPHTRELKIPTAEQMVTVWPIDRDATAGELNKMERRRVCDTATNNYGLVTAQAAIRNAKAAGSSLDGSGPFFIAWSPPQTIGGKNAKILVMDLSNVTTAEQAEELMRNWVEEIELNPELWSKGWDLTKLRRTVQQWADRHGPRLLSILDSEG